MLEIQVLALNRHKNVKLVNGIPIATSPCDNWISNGNTYIINKLYDNKNTQIHFHSNRPHTITKMNNNINMDSTIAGSMNARS